MVLFERAPAKINLSLDVLGKREDGFHEVEMIMTTVDLADRIELYDIADGRIEISTDNQYVPNDERNLAYRAALVFKNTYQLHRGVRINIRKNIPVSAGLGGGSSDAAAVLRGLNRMWSVGISEAELIELGSVLGSDVPFCITGYTALGTGHGEKIRTLASPPPCYVVLAKPNIGISTRHIFPKVNTDAISHPQTEAVIQSLAEKDFDKLCHHIGNALEDVTFPLYPEVKQLKDKMLQTGASGAMMSGSGPTIAGLTRHFSKAKRIYNGLRGFCNEVHIVQMLDRR
ncbi:4-(cytidine 5'-diphospho)-2-C-methyl-D-erythritol kinase [Lentibacillus amyloliquefaciens]|uniref:4-diphosphocytidyl-2-C-methyl-D-erythritol kinase n=1 Tax=Lentibacillus amyloliquefaciens TaxID=1472767 RepID=A0A0U4FSE5_9BACI|nr:4-(cytidine 5'-diphospho)-2-C-methyl-D-erythritol kinase [Lentibacillus amyloliquefaciens]ALX50644.1 4-diphosphocytidyl-2C-methyl-D-erythritol kinase [Lentibacillus amyloliquefaciens]